MYFPFFIYKPIVCTRIASATHTAHAQTQPHGPKRARADIVSRTAIVHGFFPRFGSLRPQLSARILSERSLNRISRIVRVILGAQPGRSGYLLPLGHCRELFSFISPFHSHSIARNMLVLCELFSAFAGPAVVRRLKCRGIRKAGLRRRGRGSERAEKKVDWRLGESHSEQFQSELY